MSSARNMHVLLDMELLVERRAFHIASSMYKVMMNIIKDTKLTMMFQTLELVHGMGTRARSRCDLIIQEVRTNFGAKAISVFGSRIFNLLPLDLRNSKSINVFTSNYWKLNKTK